MFLRVMRLKRMAAGISVSLLFMRTTSAASMATSVPAPMAMPMSALVSAGASLMPSPTMMVFPFSLSSRITASLPSGRTPATTSLTPASRPMASAVRRLSPVSITTCMPMFLSCFMASGLSGFMVSATDISPSTRSSLVKKSGVSPFSESVRASFFRSSGICETELIKLMLPA